MTQFWLGTHHPHWVRRVAVPLMISRRALSRYKTLPRALGPIFRDGGGFTELSLFGEWSMDAESFAAEARYHATEVGNIERLAPQDWMCEPVVLKKTGLTIRIHQQRTVDNYIDLMNIAPDLPWVPVLQGWKIGDYLRCIDMYERAGVNLRTAPMVGVGSICRRQATTDGVSIIQALASYEFQLHGFGFKLNGLRQVGCLLSSADSLAWSYGARRGDTMTGGCPHGHKRCNQCLDFALWWRKKVIAAINGNTSAQYAFPFAA